jgi:hypothetical protein
MYRFTLTGVVLRSRFVTSQIVLLESPSDASALGFIAVSSEFEPPDEQATRMGKVARANQKFTFSMSIQYYFFLFITFSSLCEQAQPLAHVRLEGANIPEK